MEGKKGTFKKGLICGVVATTLVFTAGIWASRVMGDELTSGEKMQAINSLIKSQFLYESDVSQETLNEGLLKGYVAGLGDPYSVYYDAEEFKSFQESTTGKFYGIGVKFSRDASSKLIEVVTVYEGMPADKAGIKKGDILYKVEGESVEGRELEDVVSNIKGEKDTEVKLTLLRKENGEEYTTTAVREEIVVPTVESSMQSDSIGYIKISEFSSETATQFEEALAKLEKEGMKGLVIDLRDNPGGLVESTCDIADKLLPEGTIMYTKDKNGNKQEEVSDEKNQFTKPYAVLVNGYSASASEILAGAIQDYGKGTVIGTKTFGKGIVQQTFPFVDGTGIKLTVSEYYTPNGRQLHKKGITPDIEVNDNRDSNENAEDNQLKRAIEEVLGKVK